MRSLLNQEDGVDFSSVISCASSIIRSSVARMALLLFRAWVVSSGRRGSVVFVTEIGNAFIFKS